jgi:plastocyanin
MRADAHERTKMKHPGGSHRRVIAIAAGLGLVLFGTSPSALQKRAKPATHRIAIETLEYLPKTMTVKVGDSLEWVNKDPFPHTATSKMGKFDSRSIEAGKSWKHTVQSKGEFPYVCTLHPTMTATVTVEER